MLSVAAANRHRKKQTYFLRRMYIYTDIRPECTDGFFPDTQRPDPESDHTLACSFVVTCTAHYM